MPTYYFRGRKPGEDGTIETGYLESANRDALVTTLQMQGLVVLDIIEKQRETRGMSMRMHGRISKRDLIQFATQLATTLDANIPLLKCLQIQIQQATSRKLKAVLEEVYTNVREGRSLKNAMQKHPKVFTSIWINMVDTGESSGQLPSILEKLAAYLFARNDLQRKIGTALIYPAALILVSLLAVYLFIVRVIPIFAGIFKDFDVQMPMITVAVINISNFLRQHILATVLITAGIIYAFYRFRKSPKGRRLTDDWSLKLPLFGSFLLDTCMERFSSSLEILLHSGIPILQALEICANTSSNVIIQKALEDAYTAVREGKSLSSSLMRSQIFPPITVSMCSVGEETGRLDKMMHQINKHYSDEINIFVERLSASLEPIVIIVVGAFVAVLLLAMYLPIFQMAMLGGG